MKNKINDLVLLKPEKNKKKITASIIYYLVGTILAITFIFPLIYMLATSTKTEEVYANNAGTIMMFLPDFSSIGTWFNNYAIVFNEIGIWKYALNTFFYAAIVIVFNILVNGLAGYVLSKFHLPAKKFFTFIILFLIVVPVETSMIPLYSVVKNLLGLKQNLSILAVILPPVISVFNIFLFIQFFQSIPKDYEEAARIDGASRLRVFFEVIVPLSKPIIATVAVFCFIGVWNDYLWPTMVLPASTGEGEWPLLTIQAALTAITSRPGITTGETMAALTVTSIPIFVLYIAAQKYIVQGFGAAGLKL